MLARRVLGHSLTSRLNLMARIGRRSNCPSCRTALTSGSATELLVITVGMLLDEPRETFTQQRNRAFVFAAKAA